MCVKVAMNMVVDMVACDGCVRGKWVVLQGRGKRVAVVPDDLGFWGSYT